MWTQNQNGPQYIRLRQEQVHPGAAIRVLLVSSEIYPLAKTGGLADVCAALPTALAADGVDIRLLMPAYPEAMDRAVALQVACELEDPWSTSRLRLWHGRTPDSGLPLWLLDSALYTRCGGPYQDVGGQDWPDNFQRFALLSRTAARLGLGELPLHWQPQVVHCQDWHTGLVPLLLSQTAAPRPATMFTIHNAAFQGNFPLQAAAALGLPPASLEPQGAEFYGRFSCLKSGIQYADSLTTVSPGYARELLTPEFGCGLDGVLRGRGDRFQGILNGIDQSLWNPATDPHLRYRYSSPDCGGKRACKLELQRSLGLAEDDSAPLAISASRLTTQKMADVLVTVLPEMLAQQQDLQFALLGRGDPALETAFRALAPTFPGRVAIDIGYEEPLAHRLHAGADLLLHSSRFEPCGLTQLYALRYGTLPVVTRVGGLADSVTDASAGTAAGTGFVLDHPSDRALLEAVDRALSDYRQRRGFWSQLQRNAMSADFGWRRSAAIYHRLYRNLADPADAVARENAEATGPAAAWAAPIPPTRLTAAA